MMKSLSRSLIILILILACEALSPSNCVPQEESGTPPSLSLEQIMFEEGTIDWTFGDFDGDGTVEFAQTNGRGVTVNEFIGTSVRTAEDFVGRVPVLKIQALDMDGDSYQEILIGMLEEDSVRTEVWKCSFEDGQKNYTRSLETEPVAVTLNENDGTWDGGIVGYQTIDANDDGRKDILAVFSCGYSLTPRGITAFDGKTGEEIWSFPMAGHSYFPVCADLDGEDGQEIVIGDRAPCNGNRAGDMDDCHSHLVCLDRHGELRWKHEMGGIFTKTYYAIAGLKGEAVRNVICTYSSGDVADESTHFELQVRRGVTGEIEKAFSSTNGFGRPFVRDFDRDGEEEIVIGNDGGEVTLFSSDLEILKTARIGAGLAQCGVITVTDIDDDGREEIISASRSVMWILDGDLEVLGTHDFGDRRRILRTQYFDHPHYGRLLSVLLRERDGSRSGVILEPHTESPGESGPGGETHSWFVFLLLLAAVVTATAAGWKVIPLVIRKLRFTASLRPKDLRDRFLETLSIFGHGKAATANLDRLSFLFKNLNEDQYSSPQYRSKLSDTIDTYYEFTAPKLVEIVDRARLVDVEREQLKKLQKNLSGLDTLVESYSKGHTSFSQVERLKEEIPEQVEAAEDIIKIMMNDLARFYSCNIGRAASGVLAALSSALTREGIHIDVQLYGATETCSGFIDKSDFTTILEELMNNAIFSMRESAEKRLIVKLTVEASRIIVEVSDTGCGIPKEDQEKIFDREFSTKKEGGFGLYHAKTTLSKYGAKIKVVKSEPDQGTKMRMEIKII